MDMFYGYLNPESTKTLCGHVTRLLEFYGYLNPESTKTGRKKLVDALGFTVT